jgi:hypothetical protein
MLFSWPRKLFLLWSPITYEPSPKLSTLFSYIRFNIIITSTLNLRSGLSSYFKRERIFIEQVIQAASPLTKVQVSNISQSTNYPDRWFSCLSKSLQSKFEIVLEVYATSPSRVVFSSPSTIIHSAADVVYCSFYCKVIPIFHDLHNRTSANNATLSQLVLNYL